MAARGQFSNRLGFIMAAAGSAVGLGNIWKFPFEVGQGGGAVFVLMYLFFCFILCFPVMVTEIAIGRKTQKNAVGAFRALGYKNWSFVGVLGILSGVLILSFYNVVAAWAFGYVFELASGHFDVGKNFGTYTTDIIKVSIYAVIFMASTALIVSQGVSKGIEKATKILMPTLVLIIAFLVIYSLTLDNALDGLTFYLQPDFSKINGKVVYSALGQAFFSLSLGMGALITYGSYVDKNDNILTSAALITLMDVGIAFIAGLMMFPFVAYLTGGTMEGVSGGAGLIFTVLPGVFASLGGAGQVVGAIFFILLSFAALTSTVSLLEVPVSYVVDEHKVKRKPAVWGMAVLIFLIGVPSMMSGGYSAFFTEFITYFDGAKPTDFLTFVSDTASDTFLPLGGLLISIFAAYAWKTKNLEAEIAEGYPSYKGSFLSKYINIAVTILCPFVLGLIFILTVLGKFFGIDLFT